MDMEGKYQALKDNLAALGSVLLAFSGGVDSSLLLAVGYGILGGNILAVTARSPLYPQPALDRASALAEKLGVEHILFDTDELSDPRFVSNPPERCYLCKSELYGRLTEIARERHLAHIIDGTQLDDMGDYRPGMQAARDFGVRSPLLEVGLSKEEVRALSNRLGLETWDLPAGPCLASRVPYTEEITPAKLAAIEKGESYLVQLGFREVRLRYVEPRTARIEVAPGEISGLLEGSIREQVVHKMKELGFIYVMLDLEGFRTGSLNRVL